MKVGKYTGKLDKAVGFIEFKKEILRRLEFLEPTTVITSGVHSVVDNQGYATTQYPDREVINNTVRLIREDGMVFNRLSTAHFGYTMAVEKNQFMELKPQHVDLKKKAILCYRSAVNDNPTIISYIDALIDSHRKDGKEWGVKYAEPYTHVSGLIY